MQKLLQRLTGLRDITSEQFMETTQPLRKLLVINLHQLGKLGPVG